MKRLILLCLVVAMCLTMLACSENGANNSPAESTDSLTSEIVYYTKEEVISTDYMELRLIDFDISSSIHTGTKEYDYLTPYESDSDDDDGRAYVSIYTSQIKNIGKKELVLSKTDDDGNNTTYGYQITVVYGDGYEFETEHGLMYFDSELTSYYAFGMTFLNHKGWFEVDSLLPLEQTTSDSGTRSTISSYEEDLRTYSIVPAEVMTNTEQPLLIRFDLPCSDGSMESFYYKLR